jgi:acyl-CoA hydrolase
MKTKKIKRTLSTPEKKVTKVLKNQHSHRKFKSVQESQVEMRELVMPHQANPQGTIFGGVVMSWIDMAAAMVATRHSSKPVVTVHIDSISFKAPIKVGHHVLILASLNFVGNTSMEIGVKVISENPILGTREVTTTAYLTFVALDEFSRPTLVPLLNLISSEDKRRNENAKKRLQLRHDLKNKLSRM